MVRIEFLVGVGRGGQHGDVSDSHVTPFRLAVPEGELDDLRARLLATRWPEPATDPAQGVGLEELRTMCAYWSDRYDWRRVEARLNSIGQFRTSIDGLRIHFLHARPSDPDTLALVLTHGWPGSVIEFLEVIGPLNEAGFHCVVPSLPGFGWSDKPAEVGMERRADHTPGHPNGASWLSPLRCAGQRLGHERECDARAAGCPPHRGHPPDAAAGATRSSHAGRA